MPTNCGCEHRADEDERDHDRRQRLSAARLVSELGESIGRHGECSTPNPARGRSDDSVDEYARASIENGTLKELRRLGAAGDASRSDLKAFLGSVTRLDGSPRRSAGAMTRAVNATRNSIDRAIGRIRKSDAALADHLDRTIKKGLALSYQTELATFWET